MKPDLRTLLTFSLTLILTFSFTIPTPISTASSKTPYSPQTSKKYASYSAVAFCPKQCVESWTCGSTSMYPKLKNVTYIQNSVTKAVVYIGYDPTTETLVTSWRGSNNAQNWIQDFNFQMEGYDRCKGCLVHAGFMADYKLNQRKLLVAAQAIVQFYKVSKIVTTGHSLGAALSLINGLQFAHKFPEIPIQVHNFGCPRIGNPQLAHYITQKIPTIYRVVHNKDLVPHLPPQLQYHHPAYQIFWDKDMKNYKQCSSSGQDKSCSNQYFPNYDPNDHDLYFIYISQTKC